MDNELEFLEQSIEEIRARYETRIRLKNLNDRDKIDYSSQDTILSNLDSSIKKNSAFVKKLKVFNESHKTQLLAEFEKLNLTKFISEVADSIVEAKLKLGDLHAVIEICTKLNVTYRDFSKCLLEQFTKCFPPNKNKKNIDQYIAYVSQQHQNVTTRDRSIAPATSINATLNSPINRPSPSLRFLNLVKTQSRQASTDGLGSQVNLSPLKLRIDLRLFAELIIAGIIEIKDAYPVLINLVCYLMIFDDNSHQNASAILTFCKGCAYEFLGLQPKRLQLLAERYQRELPGSTCQMIASSYQQPLRTFILEYYQSLVNHTVELIDDLRGSLGRGKKPFTSKGDMTRDVKEILEVKRSECVKFKSIVTQLAEILGVDIGTDLHKLDLPEGDVPDSDISRDALVNNFDNNGSPSTSPSAPNVSIWDDEESRLFYEDLLDLKTIFSNLVVRVASSNRKSNLTLSAKARGELDDQQVSDKCEVSDNGKYDNGNSIGSGKSTPTKDDDTISGDLEDKTLSSSSSESSLKDSGDGASPLSNQVASLILVPSGSKGSKTRFEGGSRFPPEQYFNKLANCVNRDMIDSAAVDFMTHFNTKFGRRKLIKTLFNVQRTRLDLLPFYARLTATLHPYVPSIGNELASMLRQDFRNLFKKKDQINIESKVKNVRYIGELIKFNLYNKEEALTCLKMLLSDFTHHHIEMTCNLLETCGRLLYKCPDSHHQTRLLLEQMMRKKMLLTVDSKYVTMIENAYYYSNPPEVVKYVVEEPPVHMYVRFLLYECLSRSTIQEVLSKIQKLDWQDKRLSKFVINCMIEVHNLKFYNIRYLAALLAALDRHHPWISVSVIDGVVEDILLMMEVNELQYNQRRIPMIRYFGELFNYKLSDSSLVFKILYSLITYGVYYPDVDQTLSQIPLSPLDSPDNLFRIKLVCDLLETSGQHLSSGPERRKLDCYLLFFQRYYWCKRHIFMLHPYCMVKSGNQFPASIEFLYNDAISNLRPQFTMAHSYSEAIDAVNAFVGELESNQRIRTG